MNLPFEAQGRSRRLNEVYILQTRNRGHRKDLYSGSVYRRISILLSFNLGWLWPFPAKMRYSPASIWRIDPELEVFLSPGSGFSMIKISIPWEFGRISLKLSLDLHFKGDLEPDSQLFIF